MGPCIPEIEITFRSYGKDDRIDQKKFYSTLQEESSNWGSVLSWRSCSKTPQALIHWWGLDEWQRWHRKHDCRWSTWYIHVEADLTSSYWNETIYPERIEGRAHLFSIRILAISISWQTTPWYERWQGNNEHFIYSISKTKGWVKKGLQPPRRSVRP